MNELLNSTIIKKNKNRTSKDIKKDNKENIKKNIKKEIIKPTPNIEINPLEEVKNNSSKDDNFLSSEKIDKKPNLDVQKPHFKQQKQNVFTLLISCEKINKLKFKPYDQFNIWNYSNCINCINCINGINNNHNEKFEKIILENDIFKDEFFIDVINNERTIILNFHDINILKFIELNFKNDLNKLKIKNYLLYSKLIKRQNLIDENFYEEYTKNLKINNELFLKGLDTRNCYLCPFFEYIENEENLKNSYVCTLN